MQNSMVVSTFFGLDWKFGPKYQNDQFKLRFGTKNNLNMQNSVVLLPFAV